MITRSLPVTQALLDSYSGSLPPSDYLIHLPSINPYLQEGSGMVIHRPSGLLTSAFSMTERAIADYWTSSIFAVKNQENYTALRPFAISRLHYVALTALEVARDFHIPIKSIADFATGESVLPDILSRLGNYTISVTETSSELRNLASSKGYSSFDLTFGEPSSVQFTVDAAFLTWTLCNCRNPLGAVRTVAEHVRPGGLVVLADSSRIMVPFKKTLSDLLPRNHPLDIHPYFFSINTLVALAELSGLKFIASNRFRDSDTMVACFERPEKLSVPDYVSCDHPDSVKSFIDRYVEYTHFFDQTL